MPRDSPVTGPRGSMGGLNSYIRYNTCALQHGPVPGDRVPETPLMPTVPSSDKEVFILGQTRDGRAFRPSDWAERLAGVMSSFRPGGAQPGSHLSYSPWCIPTVIDGVKAVIVDRELRDHDVMAWDFVLNFAKDNDLTVVETR